ncbi:MAG: NusG domain II-containing protein [Candidatus Fermentibacteraceae bacterium]|nr:NusG domain II-containing protein [Candidatus Fermentibacteraceae bacterium]MBN2608698.1 NusG domain II-containing protein [Candidatus Fermentibacteraceae bacterium]
MSSDREYPLFRPADLAIPLFLVLVFLVLGIGSSSAPRGDLFLEIHAGETTMTVPMVSDSVLLVEGNLGQMEIRLQGGRARIASSPCPGQDCVRQGWLTRPGDMSVCVPSGVFIVISCDGRSAPDAVSY